MWTLPLLIVGATVVLAIPLGLYMAWIFDGRYRAPTWLRWFEQRLDSGPQSWKQYAVALLLFNVAIFIVGFVVLALQPWMPLNPDDKKMLSPTTIFSTLCSFLTNTNLQHYSGEVHLSYFSQLVFVGWNMFVSAAVGFSALAAITRGLRGDAHMGNFYLDVWRSVMYALLPGSLLTGVLLIASGIPMTFDRAAQATPIDPEGLGNDDDGKPKTQAIARGPVAAILPIKHL